MTGRKESGVMGAISEQGNVAQIRDAPVGKKNSYYMLRSLSCSTMLLLRVVFPLKAVPVAGLVTIVLFTFRSARCEEGPISS